MRRCWVCCLRRPFYKQKTAKSKRRRKSRRYSRVPLKMYLLSLKAKVVITLTVTHNCVEKNVCFSTCFRVLHPNVLRNLYFDSPIGRSMPSFVDKTMEGIPALRSLLCDLTWRFWVVKQWEQWHSQPFVDLWPLRRFDTSSNFSKLVGKILTMSALTEEDEQPPLSNCSSWFEWRNVEIALHRILTTAPLQITAFVEDDNCCKAHWPCTWTQFWAAVVKVRTLAFQLMRIFRFWRNGEFTLFRDIYIPTIFPFIFTKWVLVSCNTVSMLICLFIVSCSFGYSVSMHASPLLPRCAWFVAIC